MGDSNVGLGVPSIREASFLVIPQRCEGRLGPPRDTPGVGHRHL